jgi:hypothetical protein
LLSLVKRPLSGDVIPVNVAELELADPLPALFARPVIKPVVVMMGWGLFVSCRDVMNIDAWSVRGQVLFTIVFLVLAEIVVQHQVLDALLLLLRRLSLGDHGHGKGGVRGQFDRAGLPH